LPRRSLLGNICLIDGAPLLFDAIEFNDDIACCDVLYDLAFLIMDLLHRRLGGLANLVLNRYLEITDDLDGLAALGFFLSCRAAVRAKIAATAAATTTSGTAPSHRRGLRAEARTYLDQANAYLAPAPPRLVAIGGLSGTGKSTLARRLAPAIGAAPGAVLLRSDVVRKRLFGVAPTDKLAATAYAPAVSRRVYDVLAADAGRVLDAGHAAIVDAVHAGARERARIAAVAGARNVAFAGLWLDAAPDRLIARVEARQGDVSDADAAIVRRQLDYDLGAIDWRRIGAEGAPETVARRAKKALSACKSSS